MQGRIKWEIRRVDVDALGSIREYADANAFLSYLIVVGVFALASPALRIFVGRMALRIAIRTETIVDDLIVDALRPFRFVYARRPVRSVSISAQGRSR